MSDFLSSIPTIADGEPVTAAVANRASDRLLRNDLYLMEMFQAAHTGQALIAFSQPLDPSLPAGAPVWFNAATARFEGAMAVGTLVLGSVQTDPRAHAWGVVYRQFGGGNGDILLAGMAQDLPVTDATQTGETPAAGTWYVSATEAGRLTQTPPAVAVPVLQHDGDLRAVVFPRWQEVRLTDDLDGLLASLNLVTSLVSETAALVVHAPGDPGDPRSTGHLALSLDLGLTAGDADVEGTDCVRSFDDTAQTFQSGPAVSGVYTQDPSVTLTGDTSRKLVTGDAGSPDVYYGRVGISTVGQAIEVPASVVQLDGTTTQEVFEEVPYYQFPSAVASSVVLQFQLPRGLPTGSHTASLHLRLLGSTAGATATLSLTRRRLATPTDTDPVDIPASATAVTLSGTGELESAYQFYDVASGTFTVTAGDTVVMRVSRGAGDGYGGHMGLIAASLTVAV